MSLTTTNNIFSGQPRPTYNHIRNKLMLATTNDIFSLQGKAIAVTTLTNGQIKYRIPGTGRYATEFTDSVVYNDDAKYFSALQATINEYKGHAINDHIVVDEIDAFIENQQYHTLGQRETYHQLGSHTVFNHYLM